MKLICTGSTTPNFTIGKEYKTTNVKKGHNVIGHVEGNKELMRLEIRPFVAFGKTGKVVANFEIVVKG